MQKGREVVIVREERIGDCRLIQGDCLEVMKQLGQWAASVDYDCIADAVVTDPLYGIGDKWDRPDRFASCGGNLWTGNDKWDNSTQPEAINMAMCLANGKAIIWGGNYYDFPPSRGYLVWDKMQSGFSLADSELAWVSEPITPKTFRFARAQLACEGKIHPTQKPLGLMKWCLGFVPNAKTILDPFMGSGTTLVACAKMGRKGIGIELDPDYFDIACKRVEEAYRQPNLFVPAPKAPLQEGMDI